MQVTHYYKIAVRQLVADFISFDTLYLAKGGCHPGMNAVIEISKACPSCGHENSLTCDDVNETALLELLSCSHCKSRLFSENEVKRRLVLSRFPSNTLSAGRT